MISTKPTRLRCFNIIEGYESISVKDAVRYARKTTGKKILTKDDGYYDCYRLPFGYGGEYVEVMMDSTSPNYGGLRYWFVCEHCHRKVVNLYRIQTIIACRHCFGLQYSSRMYRKGSVLATFSNYEKAMKIWKSRRLYYGDKPTRAGAKANRLLASIDFEQLTNSL